ncbi:unnamed protein product [Adineta ricciae]|nr:unnamed protein product [Adineta ricciae]
MSSFRLELKNTEFKLPKLLILEAKKRDEAEAIVQKIEKYERSEKASSTVDQHKIDLIEIRKQQEVVGFAVNLEDKKQQKEKIKNLANDPPSKEILEFLKSAQE